MQVAINKLAVLFASFAIAFGAALTAYAYDNLEIEIEIDAGGTEVEVTYENEDGDEVEEEYEYSTTDIDDVYTLLVEELDLTRAEIEDAVTDIDDETEEENDDAMEDAQDAIADAEEAIGVAQEYLDGLGDDASTTDEVVDGNKDLETARDLVAEAEAALTDEDYESAEEKAEQAEDLAKAVYEEEDDEDEKDGDDDEWDDDKRAEFCDNTSQAAGWGVAKKCVEQDDWEVNEKLQEKVEKRTDRMDKFAEYGKSTDRVELQNQLRELLTLLIQLMQQQMAMQEANS